MPHPFFENYTYPRSREDAEKFERALALAIPEKAAIRGIVQAVGADATRLEGASTADLWQSALDLIALAGAMERLCTRLKPDGRFQNPELQQLLADIVQAQSVTAAQTFGRTVMLLDRQNLRDRLDDLAAPDSGLRVVVVRGGAKSGKSYGRHLFEAAAKERNATPVYLGESIVSTVPEVIKQLFSALGARDRIPPTLSTEPASYAEIFLDLQEAAQDKRKHVWVAIDDLGEDADGTPLLDSRIALFCETLAAKAMNPLLGEWFRIMLIYYPEDRAVPTRWQDDFWAEDTPRAGDVKCEHVEAYLTSWVAAHGPFVSVPNIAALAKDVIDKADEPPMPGKAAVPRLKRLRAELQQAMRKLKQEQQR